MLVVWIFFTADSALLGADDTVLCKNNKNNNYVIKSNKSLRLKRRFISGFYTRGSNKYVALKFCVDGWVGGGGREDNIPEVEEANH